jgi:hypothetical protein
MADIISDDDKRIVENHKTDQGPDEKISEGSVQNQEVYAYDESRKIGVTGAVFLILNKMIGTGGSSGAKQTLIHHD